MLGRMRKNKWLRVIISLVLLAVLCGVSFVIDAVRHDPNFVIRHFAVKLAQDKTIEISYSSDKKYQGGRMYVRAMYFVPEESGEYTFTLSDIRSDQGVYLKLIVMDKELSDYVSIDNQPDKAGSGSEEEGNTLSGTALLNSGSTYYVCVDVEDTLESGDFAGSFAVTVSAAVQDDGPPEVAAGDKVRISVSPESQSCALFKPDVSSFYRFDTMTVGAMKDSVSSEVEAVKDSKGADIDLYGGICCLEAGEEYSVWIECDNAENKSAEVDVSCTALELIDADKYGTIGISSETLIRYMASAADPVAVWSVSDGDPRAEVYDRNGIPVSMDNDSGEAFSGNVHDFALVFYPDKGGSYYIYIGGEFDEGELSMAPYIGDGSSLGYDSVMIKDEPETEQQTP